MDDDELTRHKNALAERRLEKPKSMKSRQDRMWREIATKACNFDRDNIEVGVLSKITREDLLAFFDLHISGSERRKLSIHVVSEAATEKVVPDATEEPCSNEAVRIEDFDAFKRSLPLYPMPRPYGSGKIVP